MIDTASSRAAAQDVTDRERSDAALKRTYDCDICVVGDDVAGLAIAIDLARRGREVILLTFTGVRPLPLDGVLSPGFAMPTSALVDRVGQHDAQELLILSTQASERALAFAHKAGVAVGPRGRLSVARPHAAEALFREHELRQELAPDTTVLVGAQDLAALLGTSTFTAGLGVVPAERVSPATLKVALEAEVLAAGVRALPVEGPLAADLKGLRKYLTAARWRVRAFQVVITGPEAFARLGPKVAVLPRAPWVYGGFRLPAVEVPYAGMVEETGLTGLRYHFDAGRLTLAAATATRVMTRVGAARVLRRHAAELYPVGPSLSDAASGRMLPEPAGMPLVHEGERGVWYALASAGDALSHGFLAGRLISGAIAEKDDRIALLQPFAATPLSGWAGRVARFAGYWHVRLAARLHMDKIAASIARTPVDAVPVPDLLTDQHVDDAQALPPKPAPAALAAPTALPRRGMAAATSASRHAARAALHAASGWASGLAARAAAEPARRRRARPEPDEEVPPQRPRGA
ncbi:FAD-dependent oxidoreductase [Xanthobacter oligotrophicus]|uniref:FAD-dependent oxidoreductase n=1 Tax=Xanthobacter oligotrophicus TaxID=2607286 RepID=UPI0011F242D5|nr:FAD-dependent oxidoreductase [Xanthobacter oligotrophicus]MCG5234031.1 FAD-binding oxidoreductase [Xanthobacter oligotrophicus]